MEGKLSFKAVCENYEFADWELQDLVEGGEIAATLNDKGSYWFDSAEITQYIKSKPNRIYSLKVAKLVFGRSTTTLRTQAGEGKLRARRIAKVWTVTTAAMQEYMEEYSRNV